jgi:galactokinase
VPFDEPSTERWRTARAPYRIAPLGAHTDHQLGLVLGFSLEPGVRARFRSRSDRFVQATSREFAGAERFELGAEGPPTGTYGDYLRGVARALAAKGELRRGVDVALEGDLPPGGVSSSTAVQVAFLLALARVNDVRLSKIEAVRLIVDAERSYAGVQVGLLDPAVILFGAKDKIVFLDCKEGVPRPQSLARTLPPFQLIFVASGKPRDLRDGRYNARVDECRRAAAMLGSTSEPPVLRDVTLETLRRRRGALDPPLAARAEHVLTENKRVRDGLAALQQGDLRTFVALVNASGESMTRSFGAGVPETILLLDLLRGAPGILGAAYAGAGFGGGLFAFGSPEAAAKTIDAAIRPAYSARFSEAAKGLELRVVRRGEGASVLEDA